MTPLVSPPHIASTRILLPYSIDIMDAPERARYDAIVAAVAAGAATAPCLLSTCDGVLAVTYQPHNDWAGACGKCGHVVNGVIDK